MRKTLSRSAVVLAGLLLAHAAISPGQQLDPPAYSVDVRLLILRDFLRIYNSPAEDLAGDFLSLADRYRLDWRLLPSIAIVESGAGRDCQNNNMFGWDSGKEPFPSLQAGIEHVAARLATSKLYKNKHLDGKLATYNPDPQYVHLVKSVMATLGPDLLPVSGGSIQQPEVYSRSRTPK